MNDNLTERARRAVREAESSIEQAPGAAAVLNALRTLSDSLQIIERRLAMQQALLDDRLLRMETNRLFTLWNRIVRVAETALRPLTSRYRSDDRTADRDYDVWISHEQSASSSSATACNTRSGPRISAVLAASNPALLRTTVDSLCGQVHNDWELCVALREDQSCRAAFEHLGNQIRCCTVRDSTPCAALNAAADLATGEFVCFLVEGDSLSRFALYCVAATLALREYDLIYTDEDRLDASGRRTTPLFKPDWSPDLLAQCMYMGNLLVLKRTAFSQLNGFRHQNDGAHLHDLALRLAAKGARIGHVPKVLYHARPGAPRVSPGVQSRDTGAGVVALTAIICSRSPRLLRSCLEALRKTASGIIRSMIVVMHEEHGPDEALRRAASEAGAEVVSYTGVFNFSEMNNTAARLARTPGIVFLNDDVVATAPGWAEMLVSQIAVERIGVAGALLRYRSGEIQHAGIVTGIGDGAGHVGRHARSSSLWPWLDKTRNVSAVTGACLAIRTELFHSLGGFDTEFPNNFNDVDLCLRARHQGYDVVCVAASGLIHLECQTRRGIVHFAERYRFYKRWGDVLEQPDPYYSESLAPTEKIALNLGTLRQSGMIR